MKARLREICFGILNNRGDWELAARQAGVGLASNALPTALALGIWGLVLFRRNR